MIRFSYSNKDTKDEEEEWVGRRGMSKSRVRCQASSPQPNSAERGKLASVRDPCRNTQDSGGDVLIPFFYRYKLCTSLWALDRWQSVGHVLASAQQVQKLRRRPKTAPFVPENERCSLIDDTCRHYSKSWRTPVFSSAMGAL